MFTDDNVILIAPAARNLPPELQKKAIVWGVTGAIVVYVLMTLAAVWLLEIPDLMLVGGLTLVWIARKPLASDGQGGDEHGTGSTMLIGAMKTIIVADAVTGIDNVLAVTGASHGGFLLVVLDLLVSVSVVVWSSGVVLRLIEHFPITTYGGVAILVYMAAHMIVAELMLKVLSATQPPLK